MNPGGFGSLAVMKGNLRHKQVVTSYRSLQTLRKFPVLDTRCVARKGAIHPVKSLYGPRLKVCKCRAVQDFCCQVIDPCSLSGFFGLQSALQRLQRSGMIGELAGLVFWRNQLSWTKIEASRFVPLKN